MEPVYLIALIGGAALVFLLGREVTCWYFKINSMEKILKDILSALRGKDKPNA